MKDNSIIINGDCLEELKKLDDCSIDAVITDPPYGLSNTKPAQVADVLKAWVTGEDEAVPAKKGGFMGKDWDSFVPPPAVWKECMRVLKPGGHMMVFSGARTQDLMGLSIRLAGFELRDTLGWVYGSGFPKSQNVARAMDKKLGANVPIGKSFNSAGGGSREAEFQENGRTRADLDWSPMTDEAQQWSGWGTALKPAIEPIILARKPLDGTVAQNVLEHGVGGLNIDACRVGTETVATRHTWRPSGDAVIGRGAKGTGVSTTHEGRFPANVLLDEHAAKEMDEQSGVLKARRNKSESKSTYSGGGATAFPKGRDFPFSYDTDGGASRFFPVFKYQAKAPKKERPVIEREDGTKVTHPTVKPLGLMDWCVKLITPPGGVVLDPFAGSGATLQAASELGFLSIGIEQDSDYVELIKERLK